MILTAFGTTDYNGTTMANIFRNPRTYFDMVKDEFLLQNYTIPSDMPLDRVAYKLYSDPNLYWVLLLVNEIIDPYYDWILSMNETQLNAEHRYEYVGGTEQVDHYEDDKGRDWYGVVESPNESQNWYSTDAFGNPDRFVYHGTMIPITVTEFAQQVNEDKRTIRIVRQQDIQAFVDRITTIIGEIYADS